MHIRARKKTRGVGELGRICMNARVYRERATLPEERAIKRVNMWGDHTGICGEHERRGSRARWHIGTTVPWLLGRVWAGPFNECEAQRYAARSCTTEEGGAFAWGGRRCSPVDTPKHREPESPGGPAAAAHPKGAGGLRLSSPTVQGGPPVPRLTACHSVPCPPPPGIALRFHRHLRTRN